VVLKVLKGLMSMAKLLMEVRVLLEVDVNHEEVLESIRSSLKENNAELLDFDEVPIAFGIEALNLFIQAPEEEEITTKVLEGLRIIEGVSSVEIGRTSRM